MQNKERLLSYLFKDQGRNVVVVPFNVMEACKLNIIKLTAMCIYIHLRMLYYSFLRHDSTAFSMASNLAAPR